MNKVADVLHLRYCVQLFQKYCVNVVASRFVEKLGFITLVSALVYLGGCTNQPTDEQLEVWRKEAIARNAEIVADNAKNTGQSEWNLGIHGETTTGKSVKLNWQQLFALATSHLKTTDANQAVQRDRIFDFRGIPVSSLLKSFGYQSNVAEITFVCYDAYQVTLPLKDLLTYPIMLAITSNGKPIERDQGGPTYLVFPDTDFPQLQQKYDSSSWAFYVSHVVVGTESAKLQVGKRELNLTDLDKLPQVTLTEPVGYRVGWPSGKIKLHGVRMRDVLALAGVQLPPLGKVVVRGKPPIYHNPANPVTIPAANVRDCDIVLATRWGDDKQLIPARNGGPVTLAYGSNCQVKDMRWVTFVEELTTES